jgi:hypothetical protein
MSAIERNAVNQIRGLARPNLTQFSLVAGMHLMLPHRAISEIIVEGSIKFDLGTYK